MSSSNDDFSDDAISDDDSDLNPDNPSDVVVDYRPISADSDTEDVADEDFLAIRPNGIDVIHHFNSTPQLRDEEMNGFSALDLNGVVRDDQSHDEEVEGERERETSITRAFREDERRRSAPLTSENAMRVMEAMRGVTFLGFPPDWATHVPEERWVGQLRSLRGSATTTTPNT